MAVCYCFDGTCRTCRDRRLEAAASLNTPETRTKAFSFPNAIGDFDMASVIAAGIIAAIDKA